MLSRLRFFTTSLRVKLLIMFVLLSAIPLVMVGIVMYAKAYQTVSANSISSTSIVADQVKHEMDVLFADTGRLFQLGMNEHVIRFLQEQSETYQEAKAILDAFALYRQTYNVDNTISNILILNVFGKGISERRGVFQIDDDLLSFPPISELIGNPDKRLVTPPQPAGNDPLDQSSAEGPIVSYMSAVKHPTTGEVIGFMIIRMKADRVLALSDRHFARTGVFYAADRTGTPFDLRHATSGGLSPGDRSRFSAEQGTFTYTESGNGQRRFVVYSTSEATGWKLVGQVPLREIEKDADEIKALILISVGFTIFFTVLLYGFITLRIIKPIHYLKRKMQQAAGGNLDAFVTKRGQDEIGDLGQSFNTMLSQIGLLMEHHLQEQEEIKRAEFRLLQAQINPHFLYNTLDAIVWMAETRKSEEVILLVEALSKFFRLSLSKGRDWIPLADEFEHISNYLIIQQIRYRDLFDYDIQLTDDVRSGWILKLTLQPLIENAIYHGIKNKRGKGHIAIMGERSGDRFMRLTVVDNGAGMTKERLLALQEALHENKPLTPSGSGGFGLSNVHQRLLLCYGEAYRLSVASEEGAGTRVELHIPYLAEDDYEKRFSGRR